jgi:hypothetical protein
MQRQLGVLVDEELRGRIDEYRRERHLSRSDVVRLALLDWLTPHDAQPTPSAQPPQPVAPQEVNTP